MNININKNSEQVSYMNMLYECQQRMFGNTTHSIDVEFYGTVLEVEYEVFNHDDEVTFSILSALVSFEVDVLGIIEGLGGLSDLCDAVEKGLKDNWH